MAKRYPNEWGFTDRQEDLDEVIAWRDAAVADGWSIAPTYDGHESIERASSLNKDGFHAQVLTRKPVSKNSDWLAEAKVSAWGPDGMVINIPAQYDWAAIQAASSSCNYCGAQNVETERVGFAGRACKECAPKEWAKLPRNWAD